MEKVIFVELVRRGCQVDVGVVPIVSVTEVTAHHRLEQPSVVNFLDFSLAFNGTASNNVEVAFGLKGSRLERVGLDCHSRLPQ